MNNSIYFFRGEQKTLITDTFKDSSITKVQMYVWKTRDNLLGFNTSDKSRAFVEKLIGNKTTLVIPSLALLTKVDSKNNNEFNFKGITFLDHNALINDIYCEYLDYKAKEKKNELLKRYGKETITLTEPQIARWYNAVERRFTNVFSDFVKINDINYIVWAFSEFGMYFFTLNDIYQIVEKLALTQQINFINVDDIRSMPFH